ncbi:putative receptor-like protein kinase At1g80870 [Nicotiana tabacum]|uniref:non-specific serine/threonine protein kinase n=1 Tax=Nicotiana tabacum TaxID=4097 RepID=A0A1S4AE33_TOBAC|nr:putative receptor-like protein kinase At1g80870 [Nicotiana tomentosiformis]XP_016474937.1 PREDICTED: putative receptor-like protein kinase At1g80870 [Nicotiana tabacum]
MTSRQPLPSNPRHMTSTIFLVITTLASLIILFAILYFLYYLWYSLVHRSRTNPFDSNTPLVKLHRFSYKELKSATEGFSDSTSIGKGGSGTVFRGILEDGKLVAVKLLDSASFQSEREFQNELQILGGIKSPLIVSLLGYCVEKSKRLVVYEYMPNRSLQESLFSESNLCMNWSRRFDVILDVAKALAFLHIDCDPPVIHGDVKPSNVLLDSEYRAKLSDFGLSRLKLEEEFGVDLFSQELGKSQELWKSQDLSGNLGALTTGTETPTPIGTPMESQDEVDFAMALQASSSSKGSKSFQNIRAFGLNSVTHNLSFFNENDATSRNVKGKEVSIIENGVASYEEELSSFNHSKKLDLCTALSGDDKARNVKQWGKDWWWRQDGSGELCSKDYVMEWIGSQICPSTNPEWDLEKKCSPHKTSLDISAPMSKFEEVQETTLHEQELEIPKKESEKEIKGKAHNKKPRKMKEWWKEEHLDELSKKSKKAKRLEHYCKKRFKIPHFDIGKRFRFKRKRNFRMQDQNADDPDAEFSFRKGWRRKNSRSVGSDMWSGDLFSRELSSTTSMRGTLCYVAPEYGGCGYLMEKADIYSFGVLILVIVSGRRPLHVLNSPMKLEKANLLSWCKQLANAGNVLELVDERLRDDYNKEQASLCINLALACLQKMPELRPDISDIVRILKGETELPSLPFEFSPSPPSRNFSRSRRRQKSCAE